MRGRGRGTQNAGIGDQNLLAQKRPLSCARGRGDYFSLSTCSPPVSRIPYNNRAILTRNREDSGARKACLHVYICRQGFPSSSNEIIIRNSSVSCCYGFKGWLLLSRSLLLAAQCARSVIRLILMILCWGMTLTSCDTRDKFQI